MTWEADHTFGGRSTIRDVLFDAERRLAAVGVPSPNVDAAEIIAYVLGIRRSRLILQDQVDSDQRVRIEQLMTKRLSRIPLQHLLGSTGFRHIDIQVGPGVFIPRPETELVAEAAIRELRELPPDQRMAVDLCAGSGAIALSLAVEVPRATIYAVEMDEAALLWTRRNVEELRGAVESVGSRVEVVAGDATLVADQGHPLAHLAGQCGVVISNPPYIPIRMVPREPEVRDHEPKVALFGGADGLDVVRGVLHTAALLLGPGGLLVIEHADVQGEDSGMHGIPGLVRGEIVDSNYASVFGQTEGERLWRDVADRTDFNALPRFTIARRNRPIR